MLTRTFEEVEGYDDMVMLRGIDLQSHCEHHMVPIAGQAHIFMCQIAALWAYQSSPVFSTVLERLQTQETMTAQVMMGTH